jgi:hypothetical protein
VGDFVSHTVMEIMAVGVEHPTICNAERVTNISPRGEMGQVRSALGPEGCSAVTAITFSWFCNLCIIAARIRSNPILSR